MAYIVYGSHASSSTTLQTLQKDMIGQVVMIMPSVPESMMKADALPKQVYDALSPCELTWLHLQLPSTADPVWLISSEVHAQGSWQEILERGTKHLEYDLLVPALEKRGGQNDGWYHWQHPLLKTSSAVRTPTHLWKCFAAIVRVSRRFLSAIASQYCQTSRWCAYTAEIYLPTLCHQLDMTLASFPSNLLGRFDAAKDATHAELQADPQAQGKLHFRVMTPVCACVDCIRAPPSKVALSADVFERVVSVGPLCAAAHQMRRAGLRRDFASPFDWAEGGLDTVLHTLRYPEQTWPLFDDRKCIAFGGAAPAPFNVDRKLRYKLMHANGYEDEGREGEPFTETGHAAFLRRIARWRGLFESRHGSTGGADDKKTLFVAFAGTELTDAHIKVASELADELVKQRSGSALMFVSMRQVATGGRASVTCTPVSQTDRLYHLRLDMAGEWSMNAPHIEAAWQCHIWPRFNIQLDADTSCAPVVRRPRQILPAINTTAYVFRTRKSLPDVYKTLVRDLSKESVYVLFDVSENATTCPDLQDMQKHVVDEKHLIVSTTDLCLKVNPYHKHEMASESGLTLLHNALHPSIQYVWILSQSLRASGSWKVALESAVSSSTLANVDFLTTSLDHYDAARNADWYWWHRECVGGSKIPPVSERRKAFFAVIRLSRRLLQALATEHEWSAHQELYLPTFAHTHGFTLANLDPAALGARFDWANAIDPSEWETGSFAPNQLWHPIK